MNRFAWKTVVIFRCGIPGLEPRWVDPVLRLADTAGIVAGLFVCRLAQSPGMCREHPSGTLTSTQTNRVP